MSAPPAGPAAAGQPAPRPAPRRGAREALLGAAFLMATSAVGPGFLTQTTVFTDRLRASFGFAILASVLLDLAAQLTVWRVVVAAGRPASAVADGVLPGLGRALAVLVAAGGLAFNVGNVAGAGLGLEALAGVPPAIGATLSALLAIALFLAPEAGRAMDRFGVTLGLVMLALLAWVTVSARPPLGAALVRSVAPVVVDPLAILTIVGGTVGGYITFAGAHRLLDAGVRGPAAVPAATRAAAVGIGLASLVRVALFLATLGVVTRHAGPGGGDAVTAAAGGAPVLDAANPPAAVFRLAAGAVGGRLFGLLMWAAAITSVVGAAFTSVSFLRAIAPAVERRRRLATVAFIALSTAVFLVVGRPVRVLVLAGAVNGFILPVALGAMLVAARRPALVGGYRLPTWLAAAGALTALATLALGLWSAVAAAGGR